VRKLGPFLFDDRAPEMTLIYSISSMYLCNRFREGVLLGTQPIRPGDDVEAIARRILREKRAASAFYDPIRYRSVH
jgi:hypothetical protein